MAAAGVGTPDDVEGPDDVEADVVVDVTAGAELPVVGSGGEVVAAGVEELMAPGKSDTRLLALAFRLAWVGEEMDRGGGELTTPSWRIGVVGARGATGAVLERKQTTNGRYQINLQLILSHNQGLVHIGLYYKLKGTVLDSKGKHRTWVRSHVRHTRVTQLPDAPPLSLTESFSHCAASPSCRTQQ